MTESEIADFERRIDEIKEEVLSNLEKRLAEIDERYSITVFADAA